MFPSVLGQRLVAGSQEVVCQGRSSPTYRHLLPRPGDVLELTRECAPVPRGADAKANTISTAMPPSSAGLLNAPIARSEACSVRAANAVPIWQATMPSQATVVACW